MDLPVSKNKRKRAVGYLLEITDREGNLKRRTFTTHLKAAKWCKDTDRWLQIDGYGLIRTPSLCRKGKKNALRRGNSFGKI